MAVSPIVLATSRAAADALGWTDAPPSWAAALAAAHPVTVPDLAKSAEGISALGAVRVGLGGGEDADNAIVEAVLAAARGPVLTVDDALEQDRTGDAAAPLVPVSEQEMYAANAAAGDSQLVAVYPSAGSPWLDYPVIRVGLTGDDAAAVEAIVGRLTSATAQERA